MWRNYVTVGLRALAKSKTYAFINIFGLAIGMAACLMILLYVRYEMSYDRFIPDGDRVYQVQSFFKSSETARFLEAAIRSGGFAPDEVEALRQVEGLAKRGIADNEFETVRETFAKLIHRHAG
jgi:hypothetical protein